MSAILSFITFGLTQANLYDSREAATVTAAELHANQIALRLEAGTRPSAVEQVLTDQVVTDGAFPVLRIGSSWFATTPAVFSEKAVPPELRATVEAGESGDQRTSFAGRPFFVAGIPIPEIEAQYYEAVSLADLQDTMDGLRVTLLIASLLTTLAGGLIGFWASRRIFAPLLEVGTAADAIAGGRLDTRLPVGEDPDLDLILSPFNEMAQALEDRIERDARFASEVSHELRSPLMTLAASVEVLENLRDEMPERAQTALELLSADVDRLQQLVEDLLEISRFDVGAIRLHLEDVIATEMVIQSVSVLGGGGVPVRFDPQAADCVVRVDKRRMGRVIANLLDNAERYAGGATAVNLAVVDDHLQIAVEDRGPGVPEQDRSTIFDRFSRGSEGGNRSSDSGVGLGLALVDEHVRLHGGSVWVEDRPDGEPGARFVVELPVVAPSAAIDPADGIDPVAEVDPVAEPSTPI